MTSDWLLEHERKQEEREAAMRTARINRLAALIREVGYVGLDENTLAEKLIDKGVRA